jgi:hypothetical protein
MDTPNLDYRDTQNMNEKPLASISLDMDNLWSYLKTHGDSGWEKFPSYLDIFIPQILGLLAELNLKITFFIIGQDAALDKNKDVLKLLTENGHEVGNHSFHHAPWLNGKVNSIIEKEILDAEEQIFNVTGQKPIGFRAPGCKWTPTLLEILIKHNYGYDSSLFPTYISPVTRFFYFRNLKFTEEEKNKHKNMVGFKEVIKPNKPFFWQFTPDARLLELPVTTIPILRIPFHLSYLIFLRRFSSNLMFLYLKAALTLCRLTKTDLNFLVHPTDLLGCDQVSELAFFPGMELNSKYKIELFKQVVKELREHFVLVPMNTYAKSMLQKSIKEKRINSK